MIIIGYPGIGKTEISKSDREYVDLDVGTRSDAIKSDTDWAASLCVIADQLSEQGYDVLLPYDGFILDAADEYCTEPCHVFYPAIWLENEWTKRIYKRCKASGDLKDRLIYSHIQDNYEYDILSLEMKVDNLSRVIPHRLTDMNYSLKDLILEARK